MPEKEKQKRRKRVDYKKYENYDLSVITDLERDILLKWIEYGCTDKKGFAELLGRNIKSIEAVLCRASAKLDGVYDRERIKENRNAYMHKNKDKVREWNKRFAENNPDKIRKNNQNYYAKNKEKVLARTKEWREKRLAIRRSREAAGFTREQFSELFNIPIEDVKSWDSGKQLPPAWAEKLIIEKLEQMNRQ